MHTLQYSSFISKCPSFETEFASDEYRSSPYLDWRDTVLRKTPRRSEEQPGQRRRRHLLGDDAVACPVLHSHFEIIRRWK